MKKTIINEIVKLYQELPEVACKKCGLCCVSPTCTLSEFLYLFDFIQKNKSPEIIKGYLLAPVELHPDYEGNIRCMFLKEKTCEVHRVRTGACRLFGIPSLKELGLANMEECRNKISIVNGDGTLSSIKSWLEKLFMQEKNLYNADDEPYYIKGFNIQCWLDIYFDDSLDFDVFRDIKNSMNQYIDLNLYKDIYKLKTGLKEKIDKISILSSLLDSGDKELIYKLLLSIRDDYPETGMYFFEEATAFLTLIIHDFQDYPDFK